MINSILYSRQLNTGGTFSPLLENIRLIPKQVALEWDASACVGISDKEFEIIAASGDWISHITHSVLEQLRDATNENSLLKQNPDRLDFITHHFIITASAENISPIWDAVDEGTVRNAEVNNRIVLTGDLHQAAFAMGKGEQFLYLVEKELSITSNLKGLKRWFWKTIKDHTNSFKYGNQRNY